MGTERDALRWPLSHWRLLGFYHLNLDDPSHGHTRLPTRCPATHRTRSPVGTTPPGDPPSWSSPRMIRVGIKAPRVKILTAAMCVCVCGRGGGVFMWGVPRWHSPFRWPSSVCGRAPRGQSRCFCGLVHLKWDGRSLQWGRDPCSAFPSAPIKPWGNPGAGASLVLRWWLKVGLRDR
jgi:hypothetical protein